MAVNPTPKTAIWQGGPVRPRPLPKTLESPRICGQDGAMTRQSPPNLAAFSPEQKAQYDRFAEGRKPRSDGSLGGPFDPWITNPELFQRLTGLGNMLWNRTSLDRGLVELAICVTGRFWAANVE